MPQQPPQTRRSTVREFAALLSIVMTAGVVFVLDASVELGVAGAVPYIVCVWLSWYSRRPWIVWPVAVACSLLTIIGYFASEPGGEHWKVLANRGFALFAIWITALSVARVRVVTGPQASQTASAGESVWSSVTEFMLRRSVLLLLVFFAIGVLLVTWQQLRLQNRLVYSTAQGEAERYTAALEIFRTLYTEDVVATAIRQNIEVTHDFDSDTKRGKAIPLPATLSMKIGNELTRGATGGGSRLYSKFPFPYPDRNGLNDTFAKEAWAALTRQPDTPFMKLEDVAGEPVLRYAVADRMRSSCVNCHNTHVDSPKRDWKEGDVRGVLEVTLPLKHAVSQAHGDLQESVFFLAVVAVIGVVMMGLVIGRLHETTELQTRLAAIIQSSDDAIIGQTLNGVIDNWNPGAELLYGYSADEVVGQPITVIVPPDRVDEVSDLLNRIRSGERIQHFETERMRRDGSRVDVSLSISPIKDSHGIPTGVSTIARNVTEQKKAATALRQLNETLDRRVAERTSDLTQSNADLEQFAYVASHDLQEPLRAVVGYSQLLQMELGKSEGDIAEFLKNIVDGGERMQTLINDLLAYSRVNRKGTPFAEADMNEVVAEALANLDSAIRECDAHISCESLPIITGDAPQLRQLFQNLIGNALKYRSERTPDIKLTFAETPDSWIFSVGDNGIGIESQFHKQIFDIFKRLHTREQYTGTGIGLALCQRIVERHGGTIRIESEPNVGSNFHVTIPKQQPAGQDEAIFHE